MLRRLGIARRRPGRACPPRILIVFFRAQLAVAPLQELLLAASFTLIGLDCGFVIGLDLLTIIPCLGTPTGFVAAIPLAWIQPDGGPGLVPLALAVLIAVQVIESWFLTPRIPSGQTGLRWLAIIVAVLLRVSAHGGLTGALLAIPLTAFAASARRRIRDCYLVEVVQPAPGSPRFQVALPMPDRLPEARFRPAGGAGLQ